MWCSMNHTTHERASAGRPAERTYNSSAHIGCSLEDLPRTMDDWDGRRESRKSVLATWLDDESVAGSLA